jgi:Tfp pilus assembly protein PilN
VIEINLLPGNTRRSARRSPKFALPRFKRRAESAAPASSMDRWVVIAVPAWLLGPGLVGWLFVSTRSTKAQLEVAIEGARLDSVRYAEMRRANDVMRARQDTIAQKLSLIQEIDAGRFTWAHIVDEVSRAIPQYTWLVDVMYTSATTGLENPTFMINGRTGNTFALTQFMQQLEASPFIRNVTLVLTDQIRESDKLMYSFALVCQYERPSADIIETVPLFTQGDN